MAKEHHCPNCGPQPCNASTSKIHTCGVCAAVWEEVLGEGAPAPAAPTAPVVPPKPAAPATGSAPSPKPAPATASTQAPPTQPGNPGPSPAPIAPPRTAAPAQPAPPPAAKPLQTAPVAEPKPTPAGTAAKPPAPIGRRLSEVVAASKVVRCPQCRSDSLAQPSDFLEVKGRIVLIDSQSYRGHHWFADTGEMYSPYVAEPTTATPKPSGPPAGANPTA